MNTKQNDNLAAHTELLHRHPSLKPFARDHGVGLVCAQRLQKATKSSRTERERLSSQTLSICHSILSIYLDDEHRTLTAIVPPELIEEYNHRYVMLCLAIEKFLLHESNADDEIDILEQVSNSLSDYIRWEERTLFPAIEEILPEEELRKLLTITAAIDEKHVRPTQNIHSSSSEVADRVFDEEFDKPTLDPEL